MDEANSALEPANNRGNKLVGVHEDVNERRLAMLNRLLTEPVGSVRGRTLLKEEEVEDFFISWNHLSRSAATSGLSKAEGRLLHSFWAQFDDSPDNIKGRMTILYFNFSRSSSSSRGAQPGRQECFFEEFSGSCSNHCTGQHYDDYD